MLARTLTVALLACTAGLGSTGTALARTEPLERPSASAVPGRVVVQYRPGVAAPAVERGVGATLANEVRALGVRVLSVPTGTEDRVVEALQRSGKVVYAERDGVARVTDVTPNDYWWPNQWGPVAVHAPSAWATTTGSSSVVVAVLDTGLTQSADLSGNVLPGRNVLTGTTDVADDNGHGTMAASVVAARSNNGTGIASYCWSCSLLPVKVMDANGTGSYSNIAAGITWAVDHGATVLSLSLSGTADSASLHQAVTYAHDRGAVVVAAAGNDGCNCVNYPAAYPEVLGVAATDGTDTITSYSNFGSWVKLAAPGTNWAVTRSGTYASFMGTSSATPALAGIVGLLRSASPTASAAAVEQALTSTASRVTGIVAHGRADAAAALGASSTTPAPQPAPAPAPAASPATATTTFSSSFTAKSTTKTFGQTLPASTVKAALSSNKAASLTVTLRRADGSVVATSSGASPVQVPSATVPAGAYTWVVTGPAKVSFTLSVTSTT